MEGFEPFRSFGPDVAERYDDDLRGDEPETIDFLAALAGDGPVLESAIGTGRIALPLAERGLDEVRMSPHRYDAMTQILDINHMRLTGNGIQMSPISLRLVYPGELDLMARIAGLRLLHRWGRWRHEAFTVDSRRHVSVYGRHPV